MNPEVVTCQMKVNMIAHSTGPSLYLVWHGTSQQ